MFCDSNFLTSGDKFITLVPEGIVLTPLLVTCLLCITYICLLLPMRFNIKKKHQFVFYSKLAVSYSIKLALDVTFTKYP